MAKAPNLKQIQNDLKKSLRANNIYERKDIEWYTKFARFGYMDPYNAISTTREYIFFTKPDLHLYEPKTKILNPELANMPIFVDGDSRYPRVMEQLQMSVNYRTDGSPFVNLLTNAVRSSLELPQINANTMETAQNIYGTVLGYRQASNPSDNAHEFTLEFEETKYLEVYMFFKLFDEYERKKYYGEITPPYPEYITNKILHDQMSVYKIVVGEDGETIIYWAKAWGVYPISVPRDAFSDLTSSREGLKFSVSFRCQFVEDMEPTILSDFNQVTKEQWSKYRNNIPVYNTSTESVSGEWVHVPHIYKESAGIINDQPSYKLKWR